MTDNGHLIRKKMGFKKGDLVEDTYYGKGVIRSIKSGIKAYPIKVEFESDGSMVFYTIDGKDDISDEITLKKGTK